MNGTKSVEVLVADQLAGAQRGVELEVQRRHRVKAEPDRLGDVQVDLGPAGQRWVQNRSLPVSTWSVGVAHTRVHAPNGAKL